VKALSRIWRSFLQLSGREQALILVALAIIVGYIGYSYGVEPLLEHYDQLQEELATQRQLLQKKESILARRASYEQKAAQARVLRSFVERSLLPGENPDLASAKLQALLKEFARESGIELDRISPSPPHSVENYTEISISLPFQCYISELRDFLYMIETAEKFLFVPRLEIRVPNPRRPDRLRVMLEVAGYIGKPGEKEPTPEPDVEKATPAGPETTVAAVPAATPTPAHETSPQAAKLDQANQPASPAPDNAAEPGEPDTATTEEKEQ
jgi:type II secretory pathway component PulM